MRVAGRQFGLLEPGEQDWLVTQWGIALQAFVSERTAVVSVSAGPNGPRPPGWTSTGPGSASTSPPNRSTTSAPRTNDLLRDAGTTAIRHEMLVTVTVHIGKVRRRDATRTGSPSRRDAPQARCACSANASKAPG